MAEYIDRENLLDYLTMIPIDLGYREVEDIEEFVKRMPSADVRPVVHGKWVEYGEPNSFGEYQVWYWKCSACGAIGHIDDNFCQNCGASMNVSGSNAGDTPEGQRKEDYSHLVQALRYEAGRLPNKFSVNDEMFELMTQAAKAIEELSGLKEKEDGK